MSYVSLGAVVFLTLGTMACGDQASGISPVAPSPTIATPLTPAVRVALQRGLQDEYRAEAIYEGVLTDFGPVQPFTNVLTAEQRHSASIAQLFVAHGEAAPPSEWPLSRVPRFGTVAAACAAAVTAERENIALYDDLLRGDLPADVRQVFTNNRMASERNHLPAFQRCI